MDVLTVRFPYHYTPTAPHPFSPFPQFDDASNLLKSHISDILGEVALTLVNITDRYDFQTGKDFTSYVVVCTDGVVKQTIEVIDSSECPIVFSGKPGI